MNESKFIGLDVHKTSVSAAVIDADGKLVMQSIFATGAVAILGFVHGLRGTLRVTFEEGTHSAWLFDLLRPHVSEVVVCNPRKNALLKSGTHHSRRALRSEPDKCGPTPSLSGCSFLRDIPLTLVQRATTPPVCARQSDRSYCRSSAG